MTIDSFEKVIDDDRIGDIVIIDDASTDGSFEKLTNYFAGNEKVRVIKQLRNRGMSMNKRDAIAYCKNPWDIIFDSDNVLDKNYIDAIFKRVPFDISNAMYLPDFAEPNFDYREFAGMVIDGNNIAEIIDDPMGNCMLNTCNCLVNGEFYWRAFRYDPSVKEVDTLWHIYNHLKNGGFLYVVPDMRYFHRVHAGSGWLANASYNLKKGEEIKELIKKL